MYPLPCLCCCRCLISPWRWNAGRRHQGRQCHTCANHCSAALPPELLHPKGKCTNIHIVCFASVSRPNSCILPLSTEPAYSLAGVGHFDKCVGGPDVAYSLLLSYHKLYLDRWLDFRGPRH